MDKIIFEAELSETAKQWKERTFAKLIKNKHIQQWLKEHDENEAIIYANVGRFSDWVKAVEKCENCKGLAYCTQKVKGHYTDLYMDKVLLSGIHRCHYLREYTSALAHQSYYIDPKLSEGQLLIDLTTMDITQEQAAYKRLLMDITALLMSEERLKGFYLCGKPGVGKSYLAAGITNYFARKKCRVGFIHVPTLIGDLKLMFHDREAQDQHLNRIRNVPVLVLDDIGGESVTAWSRDEVLLSLLDYRMEHKLLTFFTSNYKLLELKQRYTLNEPMAAERIEERIRTLAQEVFMSGNSRRK